MAVQQRAYRSLLIGGALALAWVAGTTCWQMSGDDMSDPHKQSGSAGANRQGDGNERIVESSDRQDDDRKHSDEVAQRHAREQMVQRQLAGRDITDTAVLAAMRAVPRHRFVPLRLQSQAYIDGPLPIGHEQTISQPYIVALMTQLTKPNKSAVALDVGTGSGYQAAVLSRLCRHVYSVEIVPVLAETASQRLRQLGYDNITVRHGDGYQGWPEKGPFDLIVVAAAPKEIPPPLIEQLKPGGRLVIPVGKRLQHLILVRKDLDGTIRRENVAPVSFVPMTGEAAK